MRLKNNGLGDENKNPSDPLEAAKARGVVYGVGLSGRYRKNIITRIGFTLMGLIVLVSGVLAAHISFLLRTGNMTDYAIKYLSLLVSLAFILFGLKTIQNACSKDNPKTKDKDKTD